MSEGRVLQILILNLHASTSMLQGFSKSMDETTTKFSDDVHAHVVVLRELGWQTRVVLQTVKSGYPCKQCAPPNEGMASLLEEVRIELILETLAGYPTGEGTDNETKVFS